MEERERRLVQRTLQIAVEGRQIHAAHERLVDERAVGEGNDREALGDETLQMPFHLLAGQIQAPLKLFAGEPFRAPDEELRDRRAGAPRLLPQGSRQQGRVPPGEQRQASRREHLRDRVPAEATLFSTAGKKQKAGCEEAPLRQPFSALRELVLQESVRDLGADAGSVPRAAIRIDGAAVRQAREGGQREGQDSPALTPAAVHDEADPAGVALVARVPKAGLSPVPLDVAHRKESDTWQQK